MQNIAIPAPDSYIIKNLQTVVINVGDVKRLMVGYAAEVFLATRNAICLELIANTSKYASVKDGHIVWNMEEIDKLNNKE